MPVTMNQSNELFCVSQPCQNEGVCLDGANGFYCFCVKGWEGKQCDLDVNECKTSPCGENEECVNILGTYNCTCAQGYEGVPCQETTTMADHPTRSTQTTTDINTSGTTRGTTITNTFTGTAPMVEASTSTVMGATTWAPVASSSVGWIPGESVNIINNTYANGTTQYADSGWKVGPMIEEEISDAFAHTGQQSWYYKSGTNFVDYHGTIGPGDRTPFSPGLSLKVGRSDGAYTGDADSFYVSFWFKMAHDYSNGFGDGTRMMVVAGDPNGTAPASNYLEINFKYKYRAKLQIRTKESYPSYSACAQSRDCGDDFGTYNIIADDLDPTVWHRVEMNLRARPQDYLDKSYYAIDGIPANPSQGGAYYKTQQYDEGRYLYMNRVSFVALYNAYDPTKKGIYFDDIIYRAYDSFNPSVVLDEYSTSFESLR